MNYHKILLFFFYLIFNITFSQPNNYNLEKEFILSGNISSMDDDEMLEYATITLLKPEDSSVVTGGLSDSEGKFKVSAKSGIYNVLIEFISFKNITLKDIVLKVFVE